MRRATAIAGLSVAVLAGAARADPPPAAPAPVVQAVVDCRKIVGDPARLACYDKAADALGAAQSSGEVVSLDRAQRSVVRKQAFGFSLPSLAILDQGVKPDELNRIDDVLGSASQDADGKWILRLQDGPVWRQIDDEFLSRDPHPGSAIVIHRAFMGSFMMTIDGQPGIRVEREK
jgi:hypothetical protein